MATRRGLAPRYHKREDGDPQSLFRRKERGSMVNGRQCEAGLGRQMGFPTLEDNQMSLSTNE